jgi:Tol biopolymer transport system component
MCFLIQRLIVCLSLVLLILIGFLSIIRQKQSTAEWIAFISNRSGTYQVYIMSPIGENIHQVSDASIILGDTYPVLLSWRAKNADLDYLTVNSSEVYQHYLINPRTYHTQPLEQVQPNYNPLDWSPDGQWVTYTDIVDNQDFWIFRMHPDGSAKSRIFNLQGWFARPTFSPDAEWVVFDMYYKEKSILARVRVDGSKFKVIVQKEGLSYLGDSRWSPDGKWIAFTAHDGVNYNIYLVHPDGSELTKLTPKMTEGFEIMSSWSPDSQWIAYTVHTGSNSKIFKMRADGSDKQALLPESSFDESNPAWSSRFDYRWHTHILAVVGLLGIGLGMFPKRIRRMK